jgi:hypothetical protein
MVVRRLNFHVYNATDKVTTDKRSMKMKLLMGNRSDKGKEEFNHLSIKY